MVIRYIGLTEYNDIKLPIDINLGGPFIYELVKSNEKSQEKYWPYLKIKKESPEYIYDFYKTININEDSIETIETGVREVSAIVGRNSAGKTSALRMISNVLRENKYSNQSLTKYKYVMIQEDVMKKQLFITSNIHNFYFSKTIQDINDNLKLYGYDKPIKPLPEEAMLKRKQQIYFSGVFDKSTPLQTASNLSDISTNKKLNDFVRYIKEISHEKLLSNEVSMVDFKCQEIFSRISLLLKYPDLSTKNALMFELPDKIKISLQDLDRYKQSLYKKFPKENVSSEQILEMQSHIPQYSFQEGKRQAYIREMFRDQLGYLLMEEIILESLAKTELSFEEVCNRIWKKLCNSTNPLYKYARQLNIEAYKPTKNSNNIIDSSYSNDTYSEEEYPDFVDIRLSELANYKEILNADSKLLLDTDFTNSFEDELATDRSILNDVLMNNLVDDFNDLIENLNYESVSNYDYSLDEIRDNFVEIIEQIILFFKDFKSSSMNFNFSDIEQDIDPDKIIKELDTKENKAFYEQDITIPGSESTQILIVDKELMKGTEIFLDFNNMCADKCCHFILMNENKDNIDINKKDVFPAIEVTLNNYKIHNFINDFIDKKIKPETFDIVIDQDDICSGYNGHFDMVTRLGQLADTIDKDKTEIVVMVDEGELYLHPDAQKNFILNFLKICPFFFKERDIQLILSTNSPFILSDIPRTNILCLNGLNEEDGLKVDEGDVLGKTFGTNITTLLIKQFFMNDGIVGTFAKQKINTLISKLKSDDYEDNDNQDDKLINIIGDELVNRKLKQMRQEKLKPNAIDKLDQEIRRQEIWLDHLKTERKKLEMELSEDTSE